MSQERWDVKLVFLNGPLSVRGEVVLRGPVIRIGARPGPGGFSLENYRGIDDRQVTITAYDGVARIAPVGTAQVRLAPHEHVNWKDINVLRGETHLSPDCAFHLGPLNRGVTVRYVDCQQLGVWEKESLLSMAAQEEIQGPAPVEAKEIQATKGVPGWFIGGIVVIAMLIVAGITVPLVQDTMREAKPLGPEYLGEVFYEEVTSADPVDAKLLDGFQQPWLRFIAAPNAEAANEDNLREPENFDNELLKWTTRYANKQLKAKLFWKKLDQIVESYAIVVRAMREADLPEVFAGIPFAESQYNPEAMDILACGKGPWQFQPEVAHRYGLEVKNCRLRGSSETWSPTNVVPPLNVMIKAIYVDAAAERCRIPKVNGCEIDERRSLEKSTAAAVQALREPMEDEDLANSGAAVQLAIASHNAGYDNFRFRPRMKRGSRTEILWAYKDWLKRTNQQWDPKFLGQQVRCPQGTYANDCPGTTLNGYTQHYTYKVLGAHFLAVCYYGMNYADIYEEFRPYETFVEEDGYCARIQVPTVAQVKDYR
jgi:hypothetical protein